MFLILAYSLILQYNMIIQNNIVLRYFTDDTEVKKKPCYCPPCMAKQDGLTKKEPRKKTIKFVMYVLVIIS